MPNKVKPPLNFAPILHTKPKGETEDKDFLLLDFCSLSDESFTMNDVDGWQYHWNVTRARALAEHSGQVFRFRPADFGLTLAMVKQQYPDIDAEYAMTTDITRPLLLTLFQRHNAEDDEPNTLQLLDGWHRLYKAMVISVEVLPAYMLTAEKSELVLFAKLPPGKGINIGHADYGKGRSHAG